MEEIAIGLVTILNFKKKRTKVNQLFLDREKFGFHNTLIPTLLKNQALNIGYDLYSFIKMDSERFDYLLNFICQDLEPEAHSRPDSITPKLKLLITLRYLTERDSFNTLQNCFRVSQNRIYFIVRETCDSIIKRIGRRYLSLPKRREEWEQIQREFYKKYNFPRVIGCIDGKHVSIQKPPNSRSDFLNYKNSFSVVLLAVVASNYKFLHVECGINGRITDGGIWSNSRFKDLLNDSSNPLDLPPNSILLGDGSFPLSSNLMKPFPGARLSKAELIFNYRLSRCRRIVENAFGILLNKFKVLNNKISIEIDGAKRIVLACCCLHNFLKSVYENDNDFDNQLVDGSNLLGLEACMEGDLDSFSGSNTRENFVRYFNEIDVLTFQDKMIV